MKFKKLTKEQIIISLDRLTRFKNTKEKYLRVYTDILISSLIEPKLKKTDMATMDFSLITKMVSEIFNSSFNQNNDKTINTKLAEFENSVFINDVETQKLLNNDINYTEAIHSVVIYSILVSADLYLMKKQA